jgi:hypothetical protein
VIGDRIVIGHCSFKVADEAVIVDSGGSFLAKFAWVSGVEAARGAEASARPARRRSLTLLEMVTSEAGDVARETAGIPDGFCAMRSFGIRARNATPYVERDRG